MWRRSPDASIIPRFAGLTAGVDIPVHRSRVGKLHMPELRPEEEPRVVAGAVPGGAPRGGNDGGPDHRENRSPPPILSTCRSNTDSVGKAFMPACRARRPDRANDASLRRRPVHGRTNERVRTRFGSDDPAHCLDWHSRRGLCPGRQGPAPTRLCGYCRYAERRLRAGGPRDRECQIRRDAGFG